MPYEAAETRHTIARFCGYRAGHDGRACSESSAQVPGPRPASGPIRMRVSTPPLPNVGFAPVRPMDVIRATYDFAAQHPEVLKYVPCYCGCGSQGHKANESCFVARRDA